MEARLIIDEPATGAWNMALDEALRAWAEESGGTCLRFYQWSPATLSLGYFQPHQSRADHAGSRELAMVRRASGGGAIVHDRELTYSLVTPLRDRFAREAQSLVHRCHQGLVDVLSEWGVRSSLCDVPRQLPRGQEPFLCFQRRAADDVVLAGHKIAGSAQRRHRGSILQHGSVLLRRSNHAGELPGISDLDSHTISVVDLRTAWAQDLGRRLGLTLRASKPTNAEKDRAEWWQATRFASPKWTKKR